MSSSTRLNLSMNPLKFGLWLFMVTITMLFAALTSAYVVRRGLGNWEVFDLPDIFYISTVIIILSSITMHVAYYKAKHDEFASLKRSLFVTIVLGLSFIVTQLYGFSALVKNNIYFAFSNPSNSFVYVLTGLHAIHIVLSISFVVAISILSYHDKVHSQNLNAIQMCTTFWHFLGALWIYLFIFMALNR